MSKIIDFGQLGGFRLEQPTLERLQANTFEVLNALMGHLNVPTTGNFIVYGCEVVAGNITPGIMYIDGALCPFAGTTGGGFSAATKIKKRVQTSTLLFENGTTPAVFTTIDSIVDGTGTALSAYIRIPHIGAIPWANLVNLPADLVFDSGYVHTDNNFTNAFLVHLASIQFGAQVNVQPDWNQLNPAAPNAILNRPIGDLLTYLKKGVYIHGDLINNYQLVTIPFGDVGTDQYFVLGNLVGSGSSPGGDARINFVIRDKTATSFKLAMNDLGDVGGQNVRFEYVLVPST